LVQNFMADDLVEAYRMLKLKMDEERIQENDWKIAEKQEDDPPFSFALPDEAAYLEDDIPKALHGIFETLSCKICGGLCENAVSIQPCGHTLCSVCFRGHLQSNKTGKHRQKNACAVCKKEIEGNVDKHLVKNRHIQEAVFAFKKFIDSLQRENMATVTERSGRSSRSGSAQQASFSGLGKDEERPITTRLPPRNYSTMKSKDLKVLCDKYHLQSTGKDAKLRDKLKRFNVLWNAELDSIFPRTPSVLAKQVDKEEKAKNIEEAQLRFNGSNGQRTSTSNLNLSTAGEGSGKISSETGNPVLFKEMIERMKRQQQQTRPKTGSSHEPESMTDGGDVNDGESSPTDHDCALRAENAESPRVSNPVAMVDSTSSIFSTDIVETSVHVAPVLEGRVDHVAPSGRTQDDAIEIYDGDEDKDEPNSVDGARSQLENGDSMNKENGSTKSSARSDTQVCLKPTAEGKPVAVRNPYSNSMQSGVVTTMNSQRSSAPPAEIATPRTKRPSPNSINYSVTTNSITSSDAKRSRSPWSCPRCTLENETLNVCLACGFLR
ncbi:MAG: hypothetical protein SGILL_008495, partial [Bacillariaceae sp.]